MEAVSRRAEMAARDEGGGEERRALHEAVRRRSARRRWRAALERANAERQLEVSGGGCTLAVRWAGRAARDAGETRGGERAGPRRATRSRARRARTTSACSWRW